MATLQAATTSKAVVVTDPEAVEQLCEQYYFGNMEWKLDHDTGEFYIVGYDLFNVFPVPDDERLYDDRPVTVEFLDDLREYIHPESEFTIQSAGFTKCRFPVYAQAWRVTYDTIQYSDLSHFEPLKGYEASGEQSETDERGSVE